MSKTQKRYGMTRQQLSAANDANVRTLLQRRGIDPRRMDRWQALFELAKVIAAEVRTQS